MFNYKYQISKNWEWELRVELGGKNEIGEEGQTGWLKLRSGYLLHESLKFMQLVGLKYLIVLKKTMLFNKI